MTLRRVTALVLVVFGGVFLILGSANAPKPAPPAANASYRQR
jgi:hypothetical protein